MTVKTLDVEEMTSAIEALVTKKLAAVKPAAKPKHRPPLTIEQVEQLPPRRHKGSMVSEIVESLKDQHGTFKVREYGKPNSAHALVAKLRRHGLTARSRGCAVYVICK